MVKEGDISYNTIVQKYYLVIGAQKLQSNLSFYNALCQLEHDEGSYALNIVMVCLINNKNYRKSIQTQDLNHISFNKLIYSHTMYYDRHISMEKYKIDILKRKMLDNSFVTIKELYVKQQMNAINYISSCMEYLEQFQMYQKIVINGSVKESAIYLGILDGEILYYSKYYNDIREIFFEDFKVAVTPETGVEKIDLKFLLKEPDRKFIKEIKYIKNLVQKEKEVLNE